MGTKKPVQAQSDFKQTIETLALNGLINPVIIMMELRNIVAVLNLENRKYQG
jgi:hypothetical protein